MSALLVLTIATEAGDPLQFAIRIPAEDAWWADLDPQQWISLRAFTPPLKELAQVVGGPRMLRWAAMHRILGDAVVYRGGGDA